MKHSWRFWATQVPGWLLFAYLVVAQGLPAFDYDIGVRMGTQEPAAIVSEVGVAFWYGFALADLLIYIPLLGAGLTGHWLGKQWHLPILASAAGITVYWPVVCLAALDAARGSSGWQLVNETPYWIVLPLIALWGVWLLWSLCAATKTRSA